MKELEIRYRHWGVRKVKRSRIPDNWRELTAKQFTAVADMHICGYNADKMISQLCGLSEKEVNMMDSYQKYVIRGELEWMLSLATPHDSFIIEQLPGTRLLPPGNKLRGCSLQQFMTADTYFQLFTLHPNKEEFLNLFVGALYHRLGEYYNIEECDVPSLRRKAAKIDMERNVAEISHIDLNVRFAVYLNFILIREWLSKAYPKLFPKGEEQGTKLHRPTDWLAIFDAFIGDDVADMRKYQIMLATDAFRIMERRIKNAQKR